MRTVVVNKYKEPYDILIQRGTIWGNPFKDGTREENIENYRIYILSNPYLMSRICELKGKRLGCSCKPKKCHGDVLVELVQQFCLERF